MDWEQTKENFAPVRQGRPKAVLSDVHDAADSATKAANQNKRRELERDIREYQGDDPLEPWLRLVKWTQEQLLGGSKAQLQETIEKCTKALNALGGKYNSDVRYLRLWIQYADCLSDPADVFFFLRDKQIGHEYALFYEAHATHYELKGNCTAADAVYQEGIRRGAKPVERIKQKYVAFQTRMAQRIQRKIQEEGLRDAAGMHAGDGGPARTSFSSLRQVQPQGYSSSSGSGRPGHPAAPPPQLLGVTSTPAQGAFAAATRLPLPGVRAGNPFLPTSALPSVLSTQKPLQPLPVAVDAEFQGRRAPADVPLPGFLGLPQFSGMKELKPHAVLHKENSDQAGIWTSAALPQNKALMPSAGADSSRLEICVDEEFLDTAAPAPQQQQQQQQAQDAVRAMLDRPFLPLGAPAQLPGQPDGRPAATAAAAASSAAREAADTKVEQDRKACHLVCDVRLLADLHGKEQSFEEARALKWMSSQGTRLNAEAGTPGLSGSAHCREEQQQPALPAALSAPVQPRAQPMSAAAGSTGVPGGQPRVPFNLGPASAPDRSRAAAPAARAEPSSMRAAARKPLSDASGCMRGLSGAGMGRGGAGEEEHGCPAPRAGAGDALVQHNQQQPASFCATAGGGGGRAGCAMQGLQLDPTVTITTKAAFDILNDMFNDSLPHGAGHAAAADWQQPRACSPSAGAQGVDTAAACSGASAGGSRGSFAGRDAWAPAPEPTVTISTRDAFNMLNDMFCDQLPHEQERLRQQPRPMQGTHGLGRAASKPISASDVCRLANMSKSAAGARCTAAPEPTTASSFTMHEDTEFGISGLLAGHHGTSSSSMIYEDTDMLGNSSHNNNEAYKPTHQMTSQIARHMQITGQPPGNMPMLLHEDTEFMTREGGW